ncbi:hypothetical protein [Streptomyces sp. NPDC014733]|uniref:hypothetical protein n=1 Tax=Streptomyces sp. NPDC014733 TaxID=3364885 RepID=UPI0036FCCD16
MIPPSEPRCACGEPAVEDYFIDSASGAVRVVSHCRFCHYVPDYVPDDAPPPTLWDIAARGLRTLLGTPPPNAPR